jgi:MarR family transcriptional regulator for hemolysin
MPNEQSFAANLSHLSRALQTAFDAHLKGMGLTTARGRVLFFLSKHPQGVNQADVTEYLHVEHPTAVRILDGLEGLGYVKRLPSPNDRRAKIIALTDTGKPLAEKVVGMTKTLNDVVMQDVDPEELECARKVLTKLVANTALLSRLHTSETEAAL